MRLGCPLPQCPEHTQTSVRDPSRNYFPTPAANYILAVGDSTHHGSAKAPLASAVQTCSFISTTTSLRRGIDKLSLAVPTRRPIDINSDHHWTSPFTTTSGSGSSHSVRLAEQRTAEVTEPPGTSAPEERRLLGDEWGSADFGAARVSCSSSAGCTVNGRHTLKSKGPRVSSV